MVRNFTVHLSRHTDQIANELKRIGLNESCIIAMESYTPQNAPDQRRVRVWYRDGQPEAVKNENSTRNI